MLLVVNMAPVRRAHAATIIVNSTADNLTAADTFCTLREAIRNANLVAGGDMTSGDCVAGAVGADTITFNSSLDGMPVTLSIATTNENNNLDGDLDILDDLTVTGNGASNTIVDAADIDRVFDVPLAGLTIIFNDLTIRNGTVTGGTGDGGGLSNNISIVTINNSVISDNAALDDGGGISNNNGGTLTINDSTLIGNRTPGMANTHGGAIRNDNGSSLLVTDSLFDGNFTDLDGSGGGIWNVNNSSTTVTNSTFRNNHVIDDGGGIYISSGSATISDSTFSDNLANTDGGGLSNEGGTVTITNSTFSGNRANRNGGALANNMAMLTPTTMNLNHVTITNNIARASNTGPGDGGGLQHANGTVSNFTNTLIFGNDDTDSTTADDCTVSGATTLTSAGYNMLAGGTGCGSLSDATDMITADPELDTLQDNGGDTQTHALLGNSPAIDQIPDGTNGCGSTYTSDQRGVTRPLDGNGDSTDACDIGAFEAGALQCGIQAAAETGVYTFAANVTIDIDNDGTDLDCLRVTRIGGNHPNATMGIQTGQYWTIEALQSDMLTEATTDYTADLTLPHTVAPDVNAYVCKWLNGAGPGAGWDCSRTSSTPTTVRRDAVPGFSDWAVGDSVGPTAVALQHISVTTSAMPVAALLFVLLAGLVSWHLIGPRKR